MIIKMLFKTLQACLFWALLGAGIVLLYQFAVPYLKTAKPRIDRIVEKVKPAGETLNEKLRLESLLESARKRLAETNIRELVAAAPPSDAANADAVAVEVKETIAPETAPVAYPVSPPTRIVRADGDADALFARQVSIIDELMR